MPSIVELFVSQTVAPAPITLQQTGALVSTGGTNLPVNTYALITQPSDLTPLLAPQLTASGLSWSAGTVTVTTQAAIPGLVPGDAFSTIISNAQGPGGPVPGYNGAFVATMTGSNTFTYALATNPGGGAGVNALYSPPSQASIIWDVNSFFGQGSSVSVFVLELGPSDGTTGPPLLSTWIQNNPGIFYSYLVPSMWDGQAAFIALLNQFQSLTAKTYFFVTTRTANYPLYAGMKDVFWWLPSPNMPITSRDIAAIYQHSLAYNPSSANRMTPFAFSFLFGCTPYPTVGNNALLTAVQAAGGNYVGTGAEGGISSEILLWGTMGDGNDFTYWYSVDWIQLNSQQALANAVINGSNDPLNPLYYNQPGINTLQDVVVQTVQDAITFGLANGTVARAALDGPVFAQALDAGTYVDQDVVNAVPFIDYVTENPSAYKTGSYGGLQLVYIPQRGFTQILFFINVTQFVSQG